MTLHQCFAVQNACYQAGRRITPRGVMVHSTGANNPNLRRYVQPDDGLLGPNPNGNHFNVPLPGGRQVCVHAFIGRLADGTVAAYQTLPWDMRGWHAGGSANDTHIGFEICEDGLADAGYFAAVYREAAELAAHLCGLYGLDPLADGVLICHSEGYRRGIASNHADVTHWFPRHGKSMDDFRADVAGILQGESEELTMTKEELLSVAGTGDHPSDWAREATAWAKENKIVNGDGEGNYGWDRPVTREAQAVMMCNLKDHILGEMQAYIDKKLKEYLGK